MLTKIIVKNLNNKKRVEKEQSEKCKSQMLLKTLKKFHQNTEYQWLGPLILPTYEAEIRGLWFEPAQENSL